MGWSPLFPGHQLPPSPPRCARHPDRELGHLTRSTPSGVSPGWSCARMCTGVCVCFCLLPVPAHAEKRCGRHEDKAPAPRGGKQQEGPADRAALRHIPSELWPRSGSAQPRAGTAQAPLLRLQWGEAARPCLHVSICLPQGPDFVRTLAEKRPDAGWVSTVSSRTDNLPAEI